jgi:hypothetical protein
MKHTKKCIRKASVFLNKLHSAWHENMNLVQNKYLSTTLPAKKKVSIKTTKQKILRTIHVSGEEGEAG